MANLTPTPDQTSVAGALGQAKGGDTVTLPAQAVLVGSKGTSLTVPAGVTLQGVAGTSLIMAPDGPGGTNGVIRIAGGTGTVVRNFSIIPAQNVSPFSISGASGSRISQINYNPQGASVVAYFAYYGGVYGTIDNCVITGGAGNNELVFTRGPADSWQTPNSMGTDQTVLIEDTIFGGQGYVCDANSNARMCVRYCDILGNMKVDGHGKASNTPPRGVRQFECYRNHWSDLWGWYILCSEMRGGTGVFFDNTADHPLGAAAYFEDYGYQSIWPNLGNVFMTPKNYPIPDQVGNGMDGGPREPFYAWNNFVNGKPWARSLKTPNPGAIALYQQQMGSPTATFTENDIIKEGRDFFSDMSGLPVPNVGRGTTKAMLASKPTTVGQAWLATDQGTWNSISAPNNEQGVLNLWSGTAWAPKYTPLAYPFYPTP
jgi:hypothetical protein